MKKQILWTLTLILAGNALSLFFRHQAVSLPQPIIWVFGTIWFILFLVYGLVPVITNLLKGKE